VLAFTPAVEHALDWFDDTHELEATPVGLRYRRTCLPGSGGNGDQDAALMEALDLLLAVHNDIVRAMKSK